MRSQRAQDGSSLILAFDVGGTRIKAGLVERYVGSTGWVQQVKQILQKHSVLVQEVSLDSARLFAAAAMGDSIAEEAVHQWALHLATEIITLIHAYDPDVVVIGGGLAQAARQFLPEVQVYVHDHAWTFTRARVPVVAAQCGNVAALLGVAELAQEAIALRSGKPPFCL